MSTKLFVGVDLGGTRCRVIVAEGLDSTGAIRRQEFVLSHDFEADITQLIGIVSDLAGDKAVAAIGMSVAGDVSPDQAYFVDPSDNLLSWSHKPVRALLEQEFSCRVVMANDATAAALGEARFGAGRGHDFAFVIWGTGIGAADVRQVSGRPTCSDLDWEYYCGAWERSCSGSKIQRRYGKNAVQLSPDEWQQVMADFRTHLTAFIEATGVAHVIFGGGVALRQRQRVIDLQPDFPSVRIQVSGLGENAGLYGALALLES